MAKIESNTTLDELLEQSTVKLNIPGKAGWGTGFFVAPGKILTCAHVVKDAGGQPVQVNWANQPVTLEATVTGVFSDPYDLALLELKQPISGHPCVYLDNTPKTDRAIQSGDELYTYGYPDDFSNGAPVTGLCEGVTGDQPPVIKFKAGQVRPGLSGSPLLNRRTQKVCGIVKFTRDRSDDLGGGAIPVSAIFSKFNELVEQQTKFHKKDLRWENLLPLARCRPRTVAFTSLVITALIGLLRLSGALQGLELKTYDHLLRNRPGTDLDDRIKIIAINDEDILNQEESGEEIVGATSISNRLLTDLLVTLKSYQPRVIGLDLYREEALSPDQHQPLLDFYATQPNLITLCKVSTKEKGVDGIKAPPRVPSDQVGFSDLSVDTDNILRRNTLAFSPDSSSPCQARTSFGLNIASHYLKQKNGNFRMDELITQDYCTSLTFYDGDKMLFKQPFLIPSDGGYQGYQDLSNGCQVLIDYRKFSNINKASYSLIDILENKVATNDFKDRIILIGVVSTKKYVDYIQTPFGIGDDQQMAGIFVQAQMISQLLRAASGERAFIAVLPLWGEALTIWVWALIGGVLAWQVNSIQRLILFLSVAVIMIYIICVTLIQVQFNLWLPLIPLVLALLLTAGIMTWLTFQIKTGSNIRLLRSAHLKP